MSLLVRLVVAVGLIGATAGTAAAHAFDPNILQLQELIDGDVRVSWTTSTPTESSRPTLPESCSIAAPSTQQRLAGTRTTTWWRVDCGEGGLAGAPIVIGGAAASADTVVRLHRRDGTRWTMVARAGGDKIRLPDRGNANRLAVAWRYMTLGIEHIALGLDHLLFLIALWLLVPDRRGLWSTVTAFTVGHSLTLVMATLDVITPRSAPVEVLIALSIVVLVRQICIDRQPDPNHPLRKRTWTVAMGFGLLHGFGFAGSLRTLGVPTEQVLEALLAFNVGVEIGQLAFVFVLSAAAYVVPRSYRAFSYAGRTGLAYVLGITATLWVVERAIQLGA